MENNFINSPDLVAPFGFTHLVATKGKRTLYVAGQIALDKDGNLVGGADLGKQAEQAYENLKAVLAAGDASLSDVVKLNVYIVDFKPPQDLNTHRDVRGRYFAPDRLPPCTVVGVTALGREDLLIEIEAIAVTGGASEKQSQIPARGAARWFSQTRDPEL